MFLAFGYTALLTDLSLYRIAKLAYPKAYIYTYQND